MASLPQIQDRWVIFKEGYIFEVKRISFVNYRKFRLEDHLYKTQVTILDESKAPKLFEILHDMRSGIEQMIRNLQDIYRKNSREAHLYLLFEDHNSLSFVGATTGKK